MTSVICSLLLLFGLYNTHFPRRKKPLPFHVNLLFSKQRHEVASFSSQSKAAHEVLIGKGKHQQELISPFLEEINEGQYRNKVT
jgi:hypothetical protein